MERSVLRAAVAFGCVAAVGCARGPDDAGPGSASSSGWALTGKLADAALAGGEALALATDGSVVRGPVGDDGRFSLALPGGRTWIVHFAKDSAFGATLWVTGSAEGRSSRLRLPERQAKAAGVSTLRSALEEGEGSEGADATGGTGGGDAGDVQDASGGDGGSGPAAGDGELDLGDVSTDGGIATPENDPGEVLDADGDGVPDAEDDDADGSGVPDELEDEGDADVAGTGLLVTEIEPRPGELDVDAGEKVEVKFALALDPASVIPAAARLVDEAGAAVAVELELDRDGKELKLDPVERLVAGATYVVEIDGVVAVTGETLTSPFRSTFRVETDEERAQAEETAETLRVRKLDPEHGEDGVDLDAEIEVEFNLPLDGATVAVGEAGFQLLGPDGLPVPGLLSLERAKRLVFVPAAPLAPSSDHVVAIGAGFEAVGPQTMTGAVRFSFRTGEGDDDGDEVGGGGRGNSGRGDEGRGNADRKDDDARADDADADDGDPSDRD